MELPGTGEVVKFHLILNKLVFDFLLQLHRIVIQNKKSQRIIVLLP